MSKTLGLTTVEAEALLKKFGLNDVEEKKNDIVKKFFLPLISPISLMLITAAILSYINGKIFDCWFIIILFFLNFVVQKWQEFKANKAIAELREKLAFDVSVLRDGKWISLNAKFLVPGDLIRLGLGGIIPADGVVTNSQNLSINEAVLTGESMLKDKKTGDKIFSGSFIATGNLEAEITSTGKNTNFGKTIFSIEAPAEKSILEKDIIHISKFLTKISIAAVVILTISLTYKGFDLKELMTLDLSLIIAGIPIALPTVMTIILSIGAAKLAKQSVIIRRLSALQDLANVNLLLTDKTGTITKNEITITHVISYDSNFNSNDIIELAYYATSHATPNAIDLAVVKKFEQTGRKSNAIILNLIPYDSERKRTTAYIQKEQEKMVISLGAPQIIQQFDTNSPPEQKSKFEQDVQDAAADGFRTLAIAITNKGETEERMTIVGMLFLTDPLDEGAKETIHFMQQNGIEVKIVTGDNKLITERITRELELSGSVFSPKDTRLFYQQYNKTNNDKLYSVAAFSEILPRDKFELVSKLKSTHIVAATGDGINDIQALKAANVGIAVSNAVSALKSLADIVLVGRGISVIRNAIIESRKIFIRVYNYSVYRISESFRLIITIFILGLLYGFYPLNPLQLILLAFLNDIPIICLAVDRVKITTKPSKINVKERFNLSLLFGTIGVISSITLFVLMKNVWQFSLPNIQTIFFLKLTISGHMLIFVAHTKERWYTFLPSKEVIIATVTTQIVATTLAVSGFLMPSKISFSLAALVWVWAFIWMQLSDFVKVIHRSMIRRN
ncbi:plasma-membrane proton-efflux P-type ATPase [Candidatus Uhrbacteria bacterium]|nr:plasma-membrane proton-efflux P-type ATPase [Candidatus Uhrbacteria bacterium]